MVGAQVCKTQEQVESLLQQSGEGEPENGLRAEKEDHEPAQDRQMADRLLPGAFVTLFTSCFHGDTKASEKSGWSALMREQGVGWVWGW